VLIKSQVEQMCLQMPAELLVITVSKTQYAVW